MPSPKVKLHKVDTMVAIEHAIREAGDCFKAHAFCAGMAMLRRILDLWSAEYRDMHGMKFDPAKKERDNLYWRLRKIAEENKLYANTIHPLMDDLRITGNQMLHADEICELPGPKQYDAIALDDLRRPYQELITKVVHLVSVTHPDWTPVSTEGTMRYPIGGAPRA